MNTCTDCGRPLVSCKYPGKVPEGWARHAARGYCSACYSRLRYHGALGADDAPQIPSSPRTCTKCKRKIVRARWRGAVPEGWARYGGHGLCNGCNYSRRKALAQPKAEPKAEPLGPPKPETLVALGGYLAGRRRRLERQRRLEWIRGAR